jgi:hypothetical protein
MANQNKAFGFRPIGRVGSTVANNGDTQYRISSNYGTAIYQGDLVTLASGYLAAYSSGAALGVFLGCQYTDPTTKKTTFKNYYPGSIVASDIVAFIVDDPSASFVAQAVGTTTGISGMQIGTPATGNATYELKIIGVNQDPSVNDLTSAYTQLIVKINNHLYNSGTGTAGV